MSILKKFLKTWNGECSFQAKQTFNSINAAAKMVVPSKAAEIMVDDNSVRYQHSTIKEVVNDNTLPTPGPTDPGKGKGEKKLEHEDNKIVKK
jgi:hypothetical protein